MENLFSIQQLQLINQLFNYQIGLSSPAELEPILKLFAEPALTRSSQIIIAQLIQIINQLNQPKLLQYILDKTHKRNMVFLLYYCTSKDLIALVGNAAKKCLKQQSLQNYQYQALFKLNVPMFDYLIDIGFFQSPELLIRYKQEFTLYLCKRLIQKKQKLPFPVEDLFFDFAGELPSVSVEDVIGEDKTSFEIQTYLSEALRDDQGFYIVDDADYENKKDVQRNMYSLLMLYAQQQGLRIRAQFTPPLVSHHFIHADIVLDEDDPNIINTLGFLLNPHNYSITAEQLSFNTMALRIFRSNMDQNSSIQNILNSMAHEKELEDLEPLAHKVKLLHQHGFKKSDDDELFYGVQEYNNIVQANSEILLCENTPVGQTCEPCMRMRKLELAHIHTLYAFPIIQKAIRPHLSGIDPFNMIATLEELVAEINMAAEDPYQ